MKFFGVMLLLVLFVSCNEGVERVPEPDDLIEREQMVLVLKDLCVLEGHIQSKYVSVPKYFKAMLNSGDALFKEHGVTSEQFEASMEYYGSRQDEMISIYDDALELLNEELAQLESK